MKLTTRFLLLAAMVGTATPAFGQGIRVGPDDQVVESTLSLPYAFYNENFGFAVWMVTFRSRWGPGCARACWP